MEPRKGVGRDCVDLIVVDIKLLQVAEILQAVIWHFRDLVLLQMKSGELGHVGQAHIPDPAEVVLGQVELGQVEELFQLLTGPGNVVTLEQQHLRVARQVPRDASETQVIAVHGDGLSVGGLWSKPGSDLTYTQLGTLVALYHR